MQGKKQNRKYAILHSDKDIALLLLPTKDKWKLIYSYNSSSGELKT